MFFSTHLKKKQKLQWEQNELNFLKNKKEHVAPRVSTTDHYIKTLLT